MALLNRLAAGLRALFHRNRYEAELDEEIRHYVEMAAERHVAAGMSRGDAFDAARRGLGSVAALRDRVRDVGWESAVETFWRDLGYALRMLRRSPGFTVVAVASLALGIGANTAIFSLVNAVLLQTLPVHAPEELVEVTRSGGVALSYPTYEAIRDRNDVFSGILLTSAGRYAATLSVGAINAGEIHFSPVTGNYFAVLGAAPVLGRALRDDDLPPANQAVISYRVWQRTFAGDRDVLGRTIRFGARNYSVVGVAPPGFAGVLTGQSIDVWIPITYFQEQYLRNNVAFMFRTLARRRQGLSQDQLRADVSLIARQLSAEWNFERPLELEVLDGSGGLTLMRRQFARPLWILMAAVASLLLMTTTNVANLLLARAGARGGEMAVRLSLGASRRRLIRQLLTESLVLGLAGGAFGLVLGSAGATSLVRFLSSAMGPLDLALPLDFRILIFTSATALLVVALFGTVPALAATRLDLTAMLKQIPSAATAAGARSGPRKLLIVAQVAISCVLLTSALLFARSLRTLGHVDIGFRPENVLLLSIALPSDRFSSGVEPVRIYERILERLGRVPGVQSAAFSSERLFGGGTWTEAVAAAHFVPAAGQDREAVILVVSPRFFDTMGMKLLGGRDFDRRDDDRSGRVAIVNEAAARYYFGRSDAVGDSFRFGDLRSATEVRVVGIAQNARYGSLKQPAPRIIYLPALQGPGPMTVTNLAIRTTGEPERMADVLWKEARSEVPDLRWRAAATQAQLVEGTIARDRMLAQLSGAFSVTAIVLVCIGLYGLTAYEVSRRRAEIGVRLALGARVTDVTRLFVGRSIPLIAAGVLIGLAGAIMLRGLLESLLFGVTGSDAVSFAASAAMIMAVGAAAAYWPARRAAQLNPVATLRAD